MGVAEWFVGFGSAFGIKFSSSIDDVVWLAPFLTANSSVTVRLQNSIIYTSVCLVQTLVAMLIAYSGRKAVKALTGGNKDAWSTEKILTVGAGCLLAVYSVKLTYEYIQEMREGGDDENQDGAAADPQSGVYNRAAQGEEAAEAGNAGCCPGSGGLRMSSKQGEVKLSARELELSARDASTNVEIDNPEKTEADVDSADRSRQCTLFVIAFIGSVDDLTLFVPMLVGKSFDLFQLMGGAFLAASTIVTICIFIGLCKPIADCLSKVPLALIVIIFATVLLIKGFTEPAHEKHG
mmetsp:Transcript_117681/g.214001  ORF Transcript_117681/g.214001 Transcript_117681/m.214001 type:complete len:293 (-) Transcript_117681:152-1030(-)